MGNLSVLAKAGVELTYNSAAGTGSFIAFSGVLTQIPSIIIFDNQSNVTIVISDDGSTNFKTFVAGEALVLDMRTNKTRSAEDFAWGIGTQFFASSAAGVGLFTISYVYAK